jgi:hypothetical protein
MPIPLQPLGYELGERKYNVKPGPNAGGEISGVHEGRWETVQEIAVGPAQRFNSASIALESSSTVNVSMNGWPLTNTVGVLETPRATPSW